MDNKFEYKVISTNGDNNLKRLEDYLNDGWNITKTNHTSERIVYILVRLKEQQ